MQAMPAGPPPPLVRACRAPPAPRARQRRPAAARALHQIAKTFWLGYGTAAAKDGRRAPKARQGGARRGSPRGIAIVAIRTGDAADS